jgi:hypothetical protein
MGLQPLLGRALRLARGAQRVSLDGLQQRHAGEHSEKQDGSNDEDGDETAGRLAGAIDARLALRNRSLAERLRAALLPKFGAASRLRSVDPLPRCTRRAPVRRTSL